MKNIKNITLSLLTFLTLVSCESKVDLNGTVLDERKRAYNVDLILVDAVTYEEVGQATTDVDGNFKFTNINKGSYVIVVKDPMGGLMYASQLREFKECDYLLDPKKINYNSERLSLFFENEKILDSLKYTELTLAQFDKKAKINRRQDSIAELIFDQEENAFLYWTDPLMYFTTYHFVQVKNENQNNITINIDISHLY